MRILIFAPNIGASLSIGGGNNFVVKQAAVLSEDLGHSVVLAGFHAFALSDLARVHGQNLNPDSVQVCSGGDAFGFRLFRSFPLKLLAYNVVVSGRFKVWVSETIRAIDPDIVWFHDDIPSCALSSLRGRRCMLYVHYPLLGRTPEVCPPIARTRGRVECLNDAILQSLFRDQLVGAPEDLCEAIWTNSTVTSRAVRKVWDTRDERTVYTYVSQADRVRDKERIVMAAGAFSRGKNYEGLVEAFVSSRLTGWQLHLYGPARDAGYLRRLYRQIAGYRARGKVVLHPNASRMDVLGGFARASIIVQGGEFEPFGLSMLEGMANGAIPIAYQSEFSGSWVDVLELGKWGSGFSNTQDLATVLRRIAAEPRSTAEDLAIQRSHWFSREALREELRRVL